MCHIVIRRSFRDAPRAVTLRFARFLDHKPVVRDAVARRRRRAFCQSL